MSTIKVPVDDRTTLRTILDNTDALLLDFDRPVCSEFAHVSAGRIVVTQQHLVTA
ncbi:hypothetical protein [Saccharothrix saharensis]|uniref:hypothetical protein n=1 Tax=Saccharothrix saharensis TaxID=571190 RepID=UPI001478F401|nr:hypothetical protein [Saccharothrix saharensis]